MWRHIASQRSTSRYSVKHAFISSHFHDATSGGTCKILKPRSRETNTYVESNLNAFRCVQNQLSRNLSVSQLLTTNECSHYVDQGHPRTRQCVLLAAPLLTLAVSIRDPLEAAPYKPSAGPPRRVGRVDYTSHLMEDPFGMLGMCAKRELLHTHIQRLHTTTCFRGIYATHMSGCSAQSRDSRSAGHSSRGLSAAAAVTARCECLHLFRGCVRSLIRVCLWVFVTGSYEKCAWGECCVD